MSERLWRSQDGREQRVGEMDENHLLSAIAMAEREDGWRKIWLPRLYMELAARRCPVPPRMPVSAADVARGVRTKLGIMQEEAKVRRAMEENIRGWVEKLVSEQVARASESSRRSASASPTSTKKRKKSPSKRRTGLRSRTAQGTLSSATPSSRMVSRHK